MIGALVLSVLGLRAPAEEASGLRLQWDAPDACPGAADVTAATAELLADSDVLAQTRVQASVRIEARDDGFVMRVQIGDAARELSSPSCDELAATAAFFVAIAVDPRVLGRGGPPVVVRRVSPPGETPEPEPTPPVVVETPQPTPSEDPPTVEVDRAPVVAPPVVRSRSRSLAITGRVAAGIGTGPSPRIAAAFVPSVGLTGRGFRVELEASYWTPRRVSSRNNGDVGLVAQLWTVGTRGCGVLARGRLEIPLCAVVHAGLVHARGEGDLVSRRARVPWVGVGGGVMAIVWLGRRLGIGAGLDILASAVQGGFRSVPSGDVDRIAPLAIMATGGLFWRSLPIGKAPTPEITRGGQPGG